jgi:hypothetical protein
MSTTRTPPRRAAVRPRGVASPRTHGGPLRPSASADSGARGVRRAQKERASGPPRKPYRVSVVTSAALLFPGSGQVLNGDAMRGVMMQFFMMFLAYITWKVTGPNISPIGRIAGGGFVYVVSVLDAHGIAVKRNQAWARLCSGGTGPHGQEAAPSGAGR